MSLTMDQLRKLDEHRIETPDDPKKEALGRAESAIADLNALGFSYSLTQRRALGKRKRLAIEGQFEFSFS